MLNRKIVWKDQIIKYLPEISAPYPSLSELINRGCLALYGSTTQGIDDPFSDIDILLLLKDSDMSKLDTVSDFHFFSFEINGKPGHITAESLETWQNYVTNCMMEHIFQLRYAEILIDNLDCENLFSSAHNEMKKVVSRTFFFYHYVEMRSEHRACDNPMERHDPVGTLLSVPKTISHALRAALVLHRKPYPYEKWLFRAALSTQTGKAMKKSIDSILVSISNNKLNFPGPESENPIGMALREIRIILITAAKDRGIDEPWLEKWWLYMNQSREGIKQIVW